MTEIARGLFTGTGAVIVQLMLIALGTWISGYIASAVGKGQIAQLIHLTGMFVSIVLALKALWEALAAAAKVMGI